MVKKSLCGLTSDEIFDIIKPSGFSPVHAVLISNGIYKKSISDVSQIPKIPSRLKKELSDKAISGIFLPLTSEVSTDKSVKYLFRTETGKDFRNGLYP